VSLAAALSASGASAASICVQPLGPSPAVTLAATTCKGTIQAAVDAAGPGDLVTIARAIYSEEVVVPPREDRLRLARAGNPQPIPDAAARLRQDSPRPPGAGATPIHPRNVQVRNLTMRGGTYGVLPGAAGTVVQGTTMTGASLGVSVDSSAASGVQIVGNEI